MKTKIEIIGITLTVILASILVVIAPVAVAEDVDPTGITINATHQVESELQCVTTNTTMMTVAEPELPGFEAVFAIAGLVAVVYLVVRKKRPCDLIEDRSGGTIVPAILVILAVVVTLTAMAGTAAATATMMIQNALISSHTVIVFAFLMMTTLVLRKGLGPPGRFAPSTLTKAQTDEGKSISSTNGNGGW